MLPGEIAKMILQAHSEGLHESDCIQGFVLEPQLNYTGLMAKGAYKSWKKAKHSGRRKVGCFDFKIFVLEGDMQNPLVHPMVITDASERLNIQTLEGLFDGMDPDELKLDDGRRRVANEVQLAMLEQEINWGDEPFQSWTLFPPSRLKRPRDFIMAYLRRTLDDRSFLTNTSRITAASGSREVLPPPRGLSEWSPYLEPESSNRKPWLTGALLLEFRKAAEAMPDNPHYAEAYGGVNNA